MKDPLLASYTLEELIYEATSIKELELVTEEESKDISDKIDEDKLDEVMSWADEEERREAEAEAARQAELAKSNGTPVAAEPHEEIVATFSDPLAPPEVADGQ